MRIFLRTAFFFFFAVSPSWAGPDPKLIQYQEEIMNLPSWGGLDKKEISAKGMVILSVLKKVAELSPEEARVVAEGALEGAKTRDRPSPAEARVEQNLYIFNRLYFQIPKDMPREKLKSYGGNYLGGEKGQLPKDRPVIWPMKELENGEMVLASSHNGIFGPSFQPLKEFDFFLTRFAPRFFKQKAGQSVSK